MEEIKEYTDYHQTLVAIKSKLELLPPTESKYLMKSLVPLLLKTFDLLMQRIEQDQVIFMIKILSLEILSKINWDNDLIETYNKVVDFMPKVMNSESEDIGIKALKIFYEYYKSMKASLSFGPVEKFFEFTMNLYRNFENIVNENFSLLMRENLNIEKISIKANKSFKIINELPFTIMQSISIFSDQCTPILQSNIPEIASVFKVLKPFPLKQNTEIDHAYSKFASALYSDYLYSLTKIEYLVAFLIKLSGNVFEVSFKRYSEDIVKAIIHILENLQKENVNTRKEILSITKNLIKPFANVFYNYRDYFKNEENLIGRNVISYDFITYEVNKIIFTLTECIYGLMNFDEKAILLEELVMRINNFSVGYEFKIFIFYYICQIIDTMRNTQDPNLKHKLIYINNAILRELSLFFQTLWKILNKMGDYFGTERKERYEFLDKNIFDQEEESLKHDINQIAQANITKVYDLLLNNEYEKYTNSDEIKNIVDLLKHSNALLKVCVSLIHLEISINYSLSITQNPYVSRENYNSKIFNHSNMVSFDKKIFYLKKLFRAYILICEKIFKNHVHGTSDEGSGKLYEINLVNIYITLPSAVCFSVFQSSMSFIYKAILNNSKICPMKNCLLSIFVDTLFDTSNLQLPPEIIQTRKELFDIFLDYFIDKIHYIGNTLKSYENYEHSSVSMSVIINIFKSLFKYLNFVMEDKTKLKITNFLVNCLILTKSSKYFGNYIYVIRCLFKNLLNIPQTPSSQGQFEFYKETIHLVYGIMKFMISIKEDFPFLKEMLTEIIMIFPIKFKYMIDYAKIVFPSLIDALNMNNEIIPVGLQYLEQWMNALFHKPENVNPFLQNNINLLTTLLTSHLYKNYAISLNSLKLLSKFGGRSRNYMEDKMINPKTSPTNILVIDLYEDDKGALHQGGEVKNQFIEFPIDNIVDLCIKIVTNYKRHSEKNWLVQIKTSFKTLKACFYTFIDEEIDIVYLDKVINDIRKEKLDTYSLYDLRGYFKKMNLQEDQIKINIIYRKAEHFLVEKLLRGLFLCCTITEIEEEIRDFVKFICDYFVLIMIAKDKKNKYINVFEIDPTIILDIICEFLFSNNPTVFKNNNQTCISIAMKLINYIIDTLEVVFEKNWEIIEKLEIVDIIFMKLLNACYNNEWSKKGGGIVTLLILIKRFSNTIIYKYLGEIIRAVFLVTNNYLSSTIKIKYEGDCEAIISEIINIFIINETAVDRIYKCLNYFQDEILTNLHSMSMYSRKIAKIAYCLIHKNSKLKAIPGLFFFIDILTLEEFTECYNLDVVKSKLILKDVEDTDNLINIEQVNTSTYIEKQNFAYKYSTKINNTNNNYNSKLNYLIGNLSIKLELDNSNFLPLLANSDALYFLIKSDVEFFVNFAIINSNENSFLHMIKNLIDILATDMFLYLEITKKIHDIQFNSKFKYFFLEKFYSTKQLCLNLSIKVGETICEIENEISDEIMSEIMKFIFQVHHVHIFEQYTQANASFSSIDPYLSNIFPILSNKMSMMKSFVKLLKSIVGNKLLLNKFKEKSSADTIEKFSDLRNKMTNLVFRFIIYREEKTLLKVSKKYIKRLLEVESSTRNLLPDEELKKCIKPVLEQVAKNLLVSFKLADSLAILLQLLSTNFNESLGRKLKECIDNYLVSNENTNTDNNFVHCIISLFSHLKPVQIKEHFPSLFEIILRLEKDTISRLRIGSFFNSKYKNKLIKLLTNFSDDVFRYFLNNCVASSDSSFFIFFKRLFKEDAAYVLREKFAKNLIHYTLPQILNLNNLQTLDNKEVVIQNFIYLRMFKTIAKISPGVLNLKYNGNTGFNNSILKLMKDYMLICSTNLYTVLDKFETDRLLDNLLKYISRILMSYYSVFNKNIENIFCLLLYKKKTKFSIIKEKIKFFMLKTQWDTEVIRKIMVSFIINFPIFINSQFLNEGLKYLINPLIIHYIRNKNYDDYFEKTFVKGLTKCFGLEDKKKYYDDPTSLEIISSSILIIIFFLNPYKESSLTREEVQQMMLGIANFLTTKYSASSQSLQLYSCLGLCFVSLLFNKQGEKMLNSLNMFFFRQSQYDSLNIINLCFDTIIPLCLSKPEESTCVNRNLKIFLNDRTMSITMFFHIFSLILKYQDLFYPHRTSMSNIIMQFVLKSMPQHQNSTLTQKKMFVALLGLIVYWLKNDTGYDIGMHMQIDKYKENTLILLLKYFRIFMVHPIIDIETAEISKKYLFYIRELSKISEFNIKKFLIPSENDGSNLRNLSPLYLYSLKIALCYSKKDSILSNVDYFMTLLRQLNLDVSMNIRVTNDAIFIVRSLMNEKILSRINLNEEPVLEETRSKADTQVFKSIREFYDHHQNFLNKKRGKYIPDLDFETINALDIKQTEIMKDLLINVKSKNHNFNHDKLLELFPHFDYRYFTMFYYYLSDNLPDLIERSPQSKEIEIISKLNDNLFKLYYENWYVFTLIILQVLREEEATIKKSVFENPECDYFTSNSHFFATLKSEEIFERIKTEKTPKITICEKKTNGIEVLIESILLGFYNALHSPTIMANYNTNISKALLILFETMHGTAIQVVLELLISLYLECKNITSYDCNRFILDILKIYDYNNKKISQSLILLIVKYLENYNSEKEKNIKDIIKILMFNSRNSDYIIRKKIFKIYEKFNGKSIMTKLEWIFQIDTKIPDVDNNSWLPYSVDFLLHHFQAKKKIKRKPYSAKLKKLNTYSYKNSGNGEDNSTMMLIDSENSNNGSLKTHFSWINNYNEDIRNLHSKSLLIPIRDIVLGDITISQKMWFSIFPQVWKILTKDEQELLAVIINDFLVNFINISSTGKGPLIVKAMLESFANCHPLIRLDPEVLYILAKIHNSWNSVSFYLERMLSANIERERSFTCLNKILETLKEDDHTIGLKRYITNNKFTLTGLSYLQCTNYYKAEETFKCAMSEYKEQIEKIDLYKNNRMLIDDESFTQNLEIKCNIDLEEFPNKLDFSIWENGLVDSYKNTNKWSELLSLGEDKNDIDLKIEALWHLGKWKEIESLNVNRFHYLAKINQIYMMMSNKDSTRMDTSYQQRCMECIRSIFQDFSTFPPNFEKLNYHYYLIFQMIVEAWESTNTLKEIERNIHEKKSSDFRENLIMWRDRIPHVSEGFYSLKSILDPRNYLFDILKDIIKPNSNNPYNYFPNISDHVWNNLMFLRHARKLGLLDVYLDYFDKFNRDISGNENLYPIENYLKNMEHLKIFRNVNKNFAKGYEIVDDLLRGINTSNTHNNQNNIPNYSDNEILASYTGSKAYFAFRLGKIQEATELFKEAVTHNYTDYHLWKDWAKMSDWTLNLFPNNQMSEIWFDNTICNYLTTIIFKLDKSKYLVPRIFFLLKSFPQFSVKNKFDKQIDNIPTWIWFFWIPQLLCLMINPMHRPLSKKLLINIAQLYPQYIYYPLNNLLQSDNIREEETKNVLKQIEVIIRIKDQHFRIIDKIDLIVSQLNEKMNRSLEEYLNNQLGVDKDLQSCKNVEEAILIVRTCVSNLKSLKEFSKIDNLGDILDDITQMIDRGDTTIFNLYKKLKDWRNFIHSKLATESNYTDLSHVLGSKLYNNNFDDVEIPGYFMNKIIEPLDENKVYITRFESEYSFKFINFSQKKLLIRGSNEKLYNFSIKYDKYKDNSESKILQLQTILNFAFTTNKDTYKSNVKFLLPIKYQITNLLKIAQEEPTQYYMNEVYEFCLQKLGYDPEISYRIYEEEYFKSNKYLQSANYFKPDILKRVYEEMSYLLPNYSLKSFIHKFIINCDEIFIFRKQFATSLSVNNLLSYILKFGDSLTLDKLSFNKETGSITLHDTKFVTQIDCESNSFIKKENFPFRMSKNISCFLSPSIIYGTVPGTIRAAVNALTDKKSHIFNILFTTLYTSGVEHFKNDENMFNRYKEYADAVYTQVSSLGSNFVELDSNPMKAIMDYITLSINEDNLSIMPIAWNPWF